MSEMSEQTTPSLFARITGAVDNVIQSYLPDPLAIVLVLTLIVFEAGVVRGGVGHRLRWWSTSATGSGVC